jgi:hypothetical protein
MHVVINSLSNVTPGSSQTLVDTRHFYENRCLEPPAYLVNEKRKPKNVKELIN